MRRTILPAVPAVARSLFGLRHRVIQNLEVTDTAPAGVRPRGRLPRDRRRHGLPELGAFEQRTRKR